jgi:type II secretion system protein G
MKTASHPTGFTLLELMVTVVILGILAAASLPRLMHNKDRAAQSVAIADLRNFASAQEAFHADSARYAVSTEIVTVPAPGKLPHSWSPGQTVGTITATATGWSAELIIRNGEHCAMFVGTAPAPTSVPGIVAGTAQCAP